MTKEALGELFEISTGLLLRYEGRGVYTVQTKDRWREQTGSVVAGVVGVGGKLEENESIIDCAKRECLEELGVPVELVSARKTYLFEGSSIKEIQLTSSSIHPAYVLLLPKTEPGRKPFTIVFVYEGIIPSKPKPKDVSAVVYAADSELKQAFDGGTSTLERLVDSGAIVDSNTDFPKNIVLKPFGTVKAHLDYLSRA